MPIDTSSSGYQLGGYMALDDTGNIYVTWAGFTGILIERSADHGDTWLRSDYNGPELSRTPRDIIVDHNGNVWLLWISLDDELAPYYLNLSKSTDQGQTFTTVFRSLAYANGFLYQKLAVDPHNSIYMLWDDAEFTLTKFRDGDPAQRTNAQVPHDTLTVGSYPNLEISHNFAVHCVWEGLFYDPNTGYHEFIFCSTSLDSGSTFFSNTRVDTVNAIGGSYVQHFPSLAIDRFGTVIVGYTRQLEQATNQSDVRVVRSQDMGLSFLSPAIVSDTGSIYSSVVCVDSLNGINIVVNSHLGAQYKRSSDGGVSFEALSLVGLWPRNIASAADGYLYASGERGQYVHFTRTNLTLGAPLIHNVPTEFLLLQNYPNPFNAATVIPYKIEEAGVVELSVFDALGREITRLVSGHINPGHHSAIWDASNFSSGAYFVRLHIEGKDIQTKKLLLLR